MQLSPILRSEYPLREVGEPIFSVLPQDAPSGSYDERAKLYDAIVGSRIYNRLLWGASIDNYRSFARQALEDGTGKFLDAGSGSAVFTSEAYTASKRPIVLVDRSAGMLNAAEQRITAKADKSLSEHLAYIQADLFDLPFRKESFSTVLSMGMLHLFENKSELIDKLLDSITKGGRVYLTCLVNDRKIGEKYLSLLHKAGEVAIPHSFKETYSIIVTTSKADKVKARSEGNMAYFIITKG